MDLYTTNTPDCLPLQIRSRFNMDKKKARRKEDAPMVAPVVAPEMPAVDLGAMVSLADSVTRQRMKEATNAQNVIIARERHLNRLKSNQVALDQVDQANKAKYKVRGII
jgi:hypothetical protein